MAPHTWSYLGDTVSDATHQMYYRGQLIKEAYYRGEKIWGETPRATQFRVATHKSSRTSNAVLKVLFQGANLEYSIDGGEHVIVDMYNDAPRTVSVLGGNKSAIVTFYGIENMTRISFEGSYALYEVLDPFPEMPAVDTMALCFANTDLQKFPETLFWNNPQIKNFDSTFQNCYIGYNKTTFNTNLFVRSVSATSFNGTFKRVKFDVRLPTGLFDGAINARTFNATFDSCEFVSSGVPGDLFDTNTGAVEFIGTFADTKNMTIPDQLFSENRKAERFTACFYGSDITRIPANLFRNCVDATDFGSCFMRCYSLRNVAGTLFYYNVNAISFSHCFDIAESLTLIGSGLFSRCPNAIYFDFAFSQTGLRTFPGDTFCDYSMHFDDGKLILGHCFADCYRLSSIPDEFFAWASKITKYASQTSWGNYYNDNGAYISSYDYVQYPYEYEKTAPMYGPFAAEYNASLTQPKIMDYSSPNEMYEPLTHDYDYELGDLLDGAFVGTFSNCINLTGLIPNFWHNAVAFISEEPYRLDKQGGFNPSHFIYADNDLYYAYTEGMNEEFPYSGMHYYRVFDGVVGNLKDAVNLAHTSAMIGGCFSGCYKLENYYELPVFFIRQALFYVYNTEDPYSDN